MLTLYSAFASPAESAAFRSALLDGLGWGEAKQRLFERIERDLAPLRDRYEALIAKPADIEALLQLGAGKARALAGPLLMQLREAVGLRRFIAVAAPREAAQAARTADRAVPQFKQYREADGRFHFKLVDGNGRVLLQSAGFDSPRDAGQRIAALRRDGFAGADAMTSLGDACTVQEVQAALAAMAAAEAEKARAGA
ncbi:MAG: DUF1508 domain-containing protein [Chiayiivirga sp.]|nr:DUF1508 domain-containing protein [Chiayiivirga sp.]